ncbi:MAG TPA: thioredoxin family protein [Pirellulales bacterium]|jgi:thioredoxin 1|nr:thioredoxin family protein [Pirellulales bacterium]
MSVFTPKLFAFCVALALGPPILLVAINYDHWFATKPIDPWLAQGEVLAFETNWCGVCKAMKPVVQELKNAGFDIRTVDADTHQQLSVQYGIHVVPTFVLVRNGQEIRRASGFLSPAALKQLWR